LIITVFDPESGYIGELACLWDGDISTWHISVAYPWNSGHEHEMIVSCVVSQKLTCNHWSSVVVGL